MATLEVKTKDDTRIVAFEENRITIGRQSDNDIVLSDKVASRKHCVVERSEGIYQLTDLSSHNGTWLGENRVREANLSFGDSFRIGATHIRLLAEEGDVEVAVDEGEDEDAIKVIEEDERDDHSAPRRASSGATTMAARALATGPISKQLAPLMQACANMPIVPGTPESGRDVRLLTKKLEEIAPEHSKSAETIEALRQLLFVAFRTRTTDVHIEPKANTYSMRFRIDGQMHGVGTISGKLGISILNIIKILAQVDIAKKNIVQEGNFAVELPSRRVDFRMNLTPTVHGQKLALRFLDKGTVPNRFEDLGLAINAVDELNRVCGQDSGMIILAGPTGSGKTTTLYTALKSLDAEGRNIVTIEDPVEYELPGTTQISIDPIHNLTFASVLSSVLRQDPDVILVGEIRDQETARMALQAATTGHLVLTTIHARDSVGTIFRLLDLGIEAFLIANAVTMCISQRLIRLLCPNCKQSFKPDASMVRQMGLENRPHDVFYDAVGCKRCLNMGYHGRTALFEMLMFNSQLRDVVLTHPTIADIRKAAGEWMFEGLTECGYRHVIDGRTTCEEVNRVASMA